jgi:hypothetical protein
VSDAVVAAIEELEPVMEAIYMSTEPCCCCCCCCCSVLTSQVSDAVVAAIEELDPMFASISIHIKMHLLLCVLPTGV